MTIATRARPSALSRVGRRHTLALTLGAALLASTACGDDHDDTGARDSGAPDGAVRDARPRDGGSPDSGADGGISPRAACKRGLAYGYHSHEDLAALQPVVAWWYNWAYLPDEALRDGYYQTLGVAYVPMVWGGTFDVATITAAIPPGATTLLGFNEPNFGAQANLSAAQAAARWPDVESIADARGLTLVSPAVNFCGGDCQDTDPFRYLDDFFQACAGCRVDKVAFHLYVGCNQGGANHAQWLINHVETYKQRFAQPLWLTEFACTDAASFDDQIGFLEDAVAYLEGEPRIERYAWFSGRFAGIPFVDLLGPSGVLTPLGEAYVNAPVAPECVSP